MAEQLFASPISEPSRAVQWLCKLNELPIDYKLINLGKGETRTPEFLAMSPIGKIPVLKDGDFVLTESHAIMIYLSDKHGWDQWCPKDLKIRARINEYANWHHLNVRPSSEICFSQLKVSLGRGGPSDEVNLKKKDEAIKGIFSILEYWLGNDNLYLACKTDPTIADLSCYNEVVQLELMGMLENVECDYPHCAAWLKRMKSVPFHDEILAPMAKFKAEFAKH